MKPTKEKMIACLLAGKVRAWNRWRRATNFSHADLRYANLVNANLGNANLRNANLGNSDLRYANLRNSDLRNADLRNADLENANLRYADLESADLRNANLENAYLRNADLESAKGILQFGPMRSSGRLCHVISHDGCVMVSAGCFWGTTQELRSRVQDDPSRWDYLLLCEWAERAFSK